MTERDPDRLVDVREAATLAGLSVATIRRYIYDGRLPAYRLGPRKVRVVASDVEALLRPMVPTGPGA